MLPTGKASLSSMLEKLTMLPPEHNNEYPRAPGLGGPSHYRDECWLQKGSYPFLSLCLFFIHSTNIQQEVIVDQA